MINTPKSTELFLKAQKYIPGGVNSPVRAFKAVGGNPIFIKNAIGAYLYDEDGNQYIDLINSWGPMILGHKNIQVENAIIEAVKSSTTYGAPTKKEVEIAELICEMVPSIEKVRMVNSGTEATMSAIRLARGYTGKDKIIKFEGCYHGHGDSFLIAAGSGAMTMGVPESKGVTKQVAMDTLIAPFNDANFVELLLQKNKNNVAAIIVEPVVGNMGCVLPENNFLQDLRTLCDNYNVLLIFDEVMTGFRLAKGGAQEVFGIKPDLTTLGKIIGGGLPVGAYGGKSEIMDFISPLGPVYQAGTLSGNPIAVTAGIETLKVLNTQKDFYKKLETTTKKIVLGLQKALDEHSIEYHINQIGSMYSLFFTKTKVKDFQTAKTSNLKQFSTYFNLMLENGIYLAPSQFESLFVSQAITDLEIDRIIYKHDKTINFISENSLF